jgi:hypothetical protein
MFKMIFATLHRSLIPICFADFSLVTANKMENVAKKPVFPYQYRAKRIYFNLQCHLSKPVIFILGNLKVEIQAAIFASVCHRKGIKVLDIRVELNVQINI